MSAAEKTHVPIVQATPLEYQASLLGVCVLFLGLGVLAAPYLKGLSEVLIIVGVGVHGWGMYRIRRRNR
jgi:hypothetical protein